MKISIITACLNNAKTVGSMMKSIVSQSYQDIEHIVIDGGSTDGTQVVLNDYMARISHFVSEPDAGLYDALNKGIERSTGDIVGILHADDFYAHSDVLAGVADVFQDSGVDACYGDLLYVTDKTDKQNHLLKIKRKSINGFNIIRYWRAGPYSVNKFKWGWMPPHPTFFIRRDLYDRFGLFRLDCGTAADYELMLRFLFKRRIHCSYIPETLVCMRVGGVSNLNVINRLQANKMDRKAWELNGLSLSPWTILLKPVRKIPQYFVSP